MVLVRADPGTPTVVEAWVATEGGGAGVRRAAPVEQGVPIAVSGEGVEVQAGVGPVAGVGGGGDHRMVGERGDTGDEEGAGMSSRGSRYRVWGLCVRARSSFLQGVYGRRHS